MDKNDLEKAFGRSFSVSGDNYKASCPFHDEKTPSFLVHSTELIGRCFGCNVGGSIDTLLANYSGCTVTEARRVLDIHLDATLNRARARREEPRPVQYFPESWLAPWKKEIHKYVIARGLSTSTLSAVGTRYDSVFKRQVFPHFDREGKLLGVTGRSCVGDEPKWYHYWGYDKGSALYVPFKTDTLRPLLVVEGVFDLLWLYQNGVTNVAALLGSQPTVRQVREITSRSTETILGLDNDGAGQRGTDQAQRLLRQNNRVQFVRWPVGAHDWMDLSQGEIVETLADTLSYVQRSIIRHTSSSC